LKIRTIYKDLLGRIDPVNYDLVHAHFLFSDGAVALCLKRSFEIPYVVAVRNTDLNYFMKYRPDLKHLGYEIMRQASAIIFISPCYRSELSKKLSPMNRKQLNHKFQIVPNGIPHFWLEHQVASLPQRDTRVNVLYVGDFSRNKNIPNAIRAVEIARRKIDACLTLVGGGGDGAEDVSAMLRSGQYPFVSYRGRVDDVTELADIYRGHDIFVMPSFSETFGVAYIEALSQGLPVIHSKGQGVDGYFAKDTVAESVNPRSPQDIANKILILKGRLNVIQEDCRQQAMQFAWKNIAKSYVDIYRNVLTVPRG